MAKLKTKTVKRKHTIMLSEKEAEDILGLLLLTGAEFTYHNDLLDALSAAGIDATLFSTGGVVLQAGSLKRYKP